MNGQRDIEALTSRFVDNIKDFLTRVEKVLVSLEFAGSWSDPGSDDGYYTPTGGNFCVLCSQEELHRTERHKPECPLWRLLLEVRKELAS